MHAFLEWQAYFEKYCVDPVEEKNNDRFIFLSHERWPENKLFAINQHHMLRGSEITLKMFIFPVIVIFMMMTSTRKNTSGNQIK